jgi:hypothetical protein
MKSQFMKPAKSGSAITGLKLAQRPFTATGQNLSVPRKAAIIAGPKDGNADKRQKGHQSRNNRNLIPPTLTI